MREFIKALVLILLFTVTARGACPPVSTTLLSRTATGQSGNAKSEAPWISDDGRYILFHSAASNIKDAGIAKPVDGYNLYLYDREEGTFSAINDSSWGTGMGDGRISGDGNWITFSTASHSILDEDDGNDDSDVFVMNRTTRDIERVSVPDRDIQLNEDIHHTLQPSHSHSTSANGNVVAFLSSSQRLTRDYFNAADATGLGYIYVRNRNDGTTQIVARGPLDPDNPSQRLLADGSFGHPAISADGTTIVFASNATNLEGMPTTPRAWWIYRAVLTNSGWQVQARIGETDVAYSNQVAISPDARYVAYIHRLDPNHVDLLIHDHLLGTTINPRGSFANPAGRGPGKPFLTNRGIAWEDGIDYTGHGTYGSYYLDFTSPNAQHVRIGLTPASVGVRGALPTPPVVSADARWMVFDTDHPEVVATDGNNDWDVFVQDQQSLCTTPTARFTFTCDLRECHFDASTSTDDGAVTYDWQFGNGITGSGVTPTYIYPTAGSYVVTLTVTDDRQRSSSVSKRVTIVDEAQSAPLRYVTVAPCRILDPVSLTDGSPYVLNVVTTPCGTYANAKAVSINVAVLTPTNNGHLKLYATDHPTDTSVINFTPANTPRANNAIIPVAADGTIAIKPSIPGGGTVNVLVDINGYFTEAPGLGFAPLTPCRLYDSRANNAALTDGTSRDVLVQNPLCGVPADAAAASLNITALAMSAQGHFRLFAAGSPVPNASQLNFKADRFAIANGARVPLGANGVTVRSVLPFGGSTHLIVDVNGYFKDDAPLEYYPVTPCRALQTSQFPQGPALADGETRLVQIRGNCGIPADAKAAMLNVTVQNPTQRGNLLAWPTGVTRPSASTINVTAGELAIANGTIVPLSQAFADDLSLAATLIPGGTAHVIVDVFGYFK
ncbi:MAG TPA: PKD domain-containing protein [Thermoanaerobaculia bacterium]